MNTKDSQVMLFAQAGNGRKTCNLGVLGDCDRYLVHVYIETSKRALKYWIKIL